MNIFLEAFIDKNLGDDMMIETLINRYPEVLFYALGPENYNSEQPYSDWDNLIIVNHEFWEANLPYFDGYVNIGGSVWQDYGNNQEWYRVRQITLQQMSVQKKPRLMIGNNIGPILTKEGETFFENMMRDVDEITFRDQTSFNWAKERLKKNQIRLTADLVLTKDIRRIESSSLNRVGFTIHRDIVYPEKNSKYLNNIARIICALIKRDKNVQISFFAFDTGTSQNDLASISEMMENYLPEEVHNRVQVVTYDGDIRKIIGEIQICRHIFASHFHGIVLALLMGIPFTPFSYQNKTVDFLADIDYAGLLVDYDNLEGAVDQVIDNIMFTNNSVNENAVLVEIQRSKTNFERADHELNKSSKSSKNIIINTIAKCNEMHLREVQLLQSQLQLSKDETIGTRQMLQFTQDEVTGTRQLLQLAQDEVTGTRLMLQTAQDEVTGTRQLLQLAQDEVKGMRQMLQSAQDEVTEMRQLLQAAQNDLIGARQLLQAARDEAIEKSQMIKATQDEIIVMSQINQRTKIEIRRLRSQLNSIHIELTEKGNLITELVEAATGRQQENIQLSTQIALLYTEIASIKNSLSWKITKPVRFMKKIL